MAHTHRSAHGAVALHEQMHLNPLPPPNLHQYLNPPPSCWFRGLLIYPQISPPLTARIEPHVWLMWSDINVCSKCSMSFHTVLSPSASCWAFYLLGSQQIVPMNFAMKWNTFKAVIRRAEGEAALPWRLHPTVLNKLFQNICVLLWSFVCLILNNKQRPLVLISPEG